MNSTLLAMLLATSLAPLPAQETQPQQETSVTQQRVDLDTWALNLDPKHRKRVIEDIEQGREFSKEVEKSVQLSENTQMIEKVRRVAGGLAKIANDTAVEVSWGDSDLNPYPYEFYVVDDEEVNAFSLPGGIIYVHEGLIEFAETDDELAGVLAHEIAHAAFRHVATLRRKQSGLQQWTLPLILGALLAGGDNEKMGALIAAQGAGQAFFSGWSVEAEESADLGAFHYLQESHYDPVGLLTFMERLAHRQRSSPISNIDWGIYKTHPPSAERAETMLRRLKALKIPIRRSRVSASLSTHVNRAEDGFLEVEFGGQVIHRFGGDNALRRSDFAVANLNQFFDTRPGRWEVSHDGAMITGIGRPLFDVLPEDLRPGETQKEAINRAVDRVKGGVFYVAERLWGT